MEKDKKFIGHVYCITNNITNKQYIGQTTQTVDLRFYQHKRDCLKGKKKTVLYSAIRKYGIDNFHVDILHSVECKSKDYLKCKLNELEIQYINQYNTLVPNGYNMTKGGDSFGYVRAFKIVQADKHGNIINYFDSIMDATRILGLSSGQLSDVISGKNKTANGFYWFKKSDVNIENNKITNHIIQAKIVAQYSIDGILLNTYSSLKEAGDCNNLNPDKISQCCGKYRSFVGGFRWRYYNIDDIVIDKITPYKNTRFREVIQIDLDGSVITTYPSIKEASAQTGIMENNICSCCKGIYKTSGGFIWKYKECA